LFSVAWGFRSGRFLSHEDRIPAIKEAGYKNHNTSQEMRGQLRPKERRAQRFGVDAIALADARLKAAATWISVLTSAEDVFDFIEQ